MLINKRGISFNVVPHITENDPNSWTCGGIPFWNEFLSDREEDTAVLKQFASKDNSYIDIGSWVGSTVLFTAPLVKKCYGFEPDPEAFAALKRNVEANPQVKNITIYQKAIAASTGEISLGSKTELGDSMSSILWAKDSWKVPAISLSDFINSNNIDDCSFIKMDIEGGEFTVLPAAKEILQKTQPTLYLSLHHPWFENKKLFFDIINDVLSIYKNIYNIHGQKLTLQEVSQIPHFAGIVATNI